MTYGQRFVLIEELERDRSPITLRQNRPEHRAREDEQSAEMKTPGSRARRWRSIARRCLRQREDGVAAVARHDHVLLALMQIRHQAVLPRTRNRH